MKKQSLILFCLFGVTLGCENSSADQSFPLVTFSDTDTTAEHIQESDNTNSIVEETSDDIDLEEFWQEKITPIINNKGLQTDRIFHFPLEGDWGYIVELNKPDSLWTKKDFIDNYDKLFSQEVRDKLSSQTHQDVDIIENNKGYIELLVGGGWETWIDDFKDESGIIFRFRKIDND